MRGLTLFALVALSLLVAGTLAGRPLVAFATSGSMTPAIAVGDAFLVNPLDRVPDVGEVVVYAPAAAPEALAVHRVVAGTSAGFVTRGDANAVTDQDAGEPLVTPDRIRGVVVAGADGEPLVLRGAALPLLRARLLALHAWEASRLPASAIALAAGAATLAVALAPRRRKPASPRSRTRRLFPRGLLAKHVALALVAVLAAGSALAAARATEETKLALVVSDAPPPGSSRATTPGGTVAREVSVAAFPLVPTLVLVDGEARSAPSAGSVLLPPGGERRIPVSLVAADEVGLDEHVVRIARYPAVLPPSATRALHDALPGLPTALVGLALSLGAWAWWRSLALGDAPLASLLPRGRRPA